MRASSENVTDIILHTVKNDHTLLDNETIFQNYPPLLLDIAAGFCILFAVVGVIGNLLSAVALSMCQKLCNATTVFIVNLCIADFIFCCFTLPLSAVTFLERKWIYGDNLCKLFALYRYSNGAVSLLSVIAITLNRYVLIVYPKYYNSIYKPKYIGIMVALLWMLPLMLLSLPLFEVWGQLGFDKDVGTCTILPLNQKSPKVLIYILAFCLPSVIFIVCYSRIFWVVRRTSRNARRTSVWYKVTISPTICFESVECGVSKTHKTNKNSSSTLNLHKDNRKELHVLRIMMFIFIMFIICYFPISFVKMLRKENDLRYLNIIGYLAVYFSNCINPIIYIVISKEYRTAYFIFCCSSFYKKKTKRQQTTQVAHNDSFRCVGGRLFSLQTPITASDLSESFES